MPAGAWAWGQGRMSAEPSRILVTGGRGQLGHALECARWPEGVVVAPRDRAALDICRMDALRDTLRTTRPVMAINAAAYTAVDRAESEPETAFAINRDGAANVAQACAEASIPLLHMSTDYVFDGSARRPYREADAPCPLGVYGASKAAGEAAVRERLDRHMILRTSWLYGPHGRNFLTNMVRQARDRRELAVIDDQYGCPTSVNDLAAAVVGVVRQLLTRSTRGFGTYHVCGSEAMTWYGFAMRIFELVGRRGGAVPRLRPVGSEAYAAAARRPAYSVLDCARFSRLFAFEARPLETNLAECLDVLAGTEAFAR